RDLRQRRGRSRAWLAGSAPAHISSKRTIAYDRAAMAEERIESQGYFEMLWDCDHCETKGLLGKSQRHCPECGAKQNPDKRYFPEEGKAQRVDGHKYEGADRQCSSCNAAISAAAKNCTNCGAPQDGWKEVRGVEVPKVVAPKRRTWLIVLIVVALAAAL